MTLRVEGIGKTYLPPPWYLRPVLRAASNEPVDALREISFSVEPGEIVGLIGPNGAGKTTLLKVVSTLLTPSAGSLTIDGLDALAQPHEARKRVGLLLTEDRSTYWRLSGRRNLEFFGVLSGLTPEVARARADELLHRMGLADRDRRVMGYSSGMRASLGIARAIIAEPSLVILDEPTRSLDPRASSRVGALLQEQAEQGRSVLLSSHRMDEVASLCDRVVLLLDGSMRYYGEPDVEGQGDKIRSLLQLFEPEEDEL
jgi:ABC-type multidrug transport system ATPase subunit